MRATSPRMTQFDRFAENLYRENLRGFHELQAMKHGLMARLPLDEAGALELATKIVLGPKNGHHKQQGDKAMSDDFKLTEQEIQQILAARQKQTTPDEEQQIVDRAAAQAKQQIEQLRTGKVQAALNAEWNREMRGLMTRRASLQEKLEVKAKYQALGLTDFTPRMVSDE